MASVVIDTAPLVLVVGVVLLGAAIMGFAARKVGLPAVVGYLLTGLLVSPFKSAFLESYDQLSLLADIGVVLLLFEVGIEIDLRRISREQKALVWGVPAQVAIGLLIGTPVFLLLDIPLLGALLLSLSIAMSSSVVIVNITRSRRRKTDTQTEEALLGWAVMQDITGVTLAAIILALFGSGDKSLLVALGGILGFVAVAYFAAKVMPVILKLVRWEKDLFLIFSVSIGLALAALGTVVFGIPMALAGFVAGLAINQSRDTDEVRKAILPFRDLFAVLFFVIIGSLIEADQFSSALPFALLIIALVIFAKSLPVVVLARIGKLNANPFQLGVGVGQVGEFSFVLGSIAFSQGAIDRGQFIGVLLAVIISIIGSVLLVRIRPTSESPS
ncbi:MAG: cation:proton antiporter [Candidatus Planktophila sp.]|jgi:monovalent cation:H+ antiporter-2, CPA2 family|tara:strand:- start:8100 stop:9257 length:1158 start_codon:yes stop_codon:yes gene_type:complete